MPGARAGASPRSNARCAAGGRLEPAREVPLLAHRVRKAARRGAQRRVPEPGRIRLPVPGGRRIWRRRRRAARASWRACWRRHCERRRRTGGVAALLRRRRSPTRTARIAAALTSGERRAIWLGALALRHPRLRRAARCWRAALARVTGATLGELAEGGNAAGAYLAGVLPHRAAGGAARASAGPATRARCSTQPLGGYLLLGRRALGRLRCSRARRRRCSGASFVVAVTPYRQRRRQVPVAHVLLPIGTFAETSGTYVNLEGRWQSFAGAAQPRGRGAAGLEGPARARQPAGPRRLRLPVVRGGARRAARRRGAPRRSRYASGCTRPAPAARSSALRRRADVPGRSAAAPRAVAAAHARGRRPRRGVSARGRSDELHGCNAGWLALPGYVQSTAFILVVTVVLILSRRLPDAVGAQGDRLDAAAPRPEPRAHVRHSCTGHRPAVRRRDQAADQGSRHPGAVEQASCSGWRRRSR